MSCNDCETIQYNYSKGAPIGHCYVRVGNGNVQIIGCDKHCKELLEELQK